MVKSGQVITSMFATANPTTGAAQNADALPTATLYVNKVANAAVVTVANVATGLYSASVTLPALAAGDTVSVAVNATVATVAGNNVIFQDIADTYRTSDVQATATAIKLKTDTIEGNGGNKTLAYRVLLDSNGDGIADVPNVGVPNISCVLTSDAAGTTQIGSAHVTDSQGYAYFRGLVAGTYYVWRDGAGFTGANPDTEVVA